MPDDSNDHAGRAGARASRRRARRRRAASALVLTLGAGALAPRLGPLAWPLDMLAQLAFPVALAATVLGLWLVVRRSWTLVAACAVVVAAYAVALGAWRAPHARPGTGDVHVLLYNMSPSNPDPLGALEDVLGHGADVVVLTETPRPVFRLAGDRIDGRAPPDDRYPHVERRRVERGRVPWRVVLSRWPMEAVETGAEPDVLALRIERPEGAFVLVSGHPVSPRTPARWRDGNGVVRAMAGVAREASDAGLPVIVAADLNATPTGARSRLLCAGADLRRAKPLLAGPTWPAPWPVGMAIDDVWVDAGARITVWRRLPAGGSDHRPVLVGIALP